MRCGGVGNGEHRGDKPVEGPAEEQKAGWSVTGTRHGQVKFSQSSAAKRRRKDWGRCMAGARGLVKVYAEEKEWSRGQGLILEPMRGVFEKHSGGRKPELGDCGGEERGTSSGDSPL